jgi:alpha-galactosidase
MAALADAIHDRGLRGGIYTDAGPYIPGTCGLGSGGHYQTDADTFAQWGYDAVKADFLCGITADLDPQEAFTAFAHALRNNSSGRSMIFNLCNPVTSPDWGDYPQEQQSTWSWTYAPDIAESWRTYTDVGFVGQIQFKDVLRNFDANARHPEVAGPGHFSDPDYLGPELGMTTEEFRTQMSLWTVAAAPLIISSDPRTLSQESMDILLDEDVLAIDQDRLGVQGTRVGAAGTTETWAKPLADGSVAVPTTDLLAAAGDRLTTEVTLHNDGSTSVRRPVVSLTAPDGWTVSPAGTAPRVVRPGDSATVAFTVDVPPGTGTGGYDVAATVAYGGALAGTTPPSCVTIAPGAPSGSGVVLSRHRG